MTSFWNSECRTEKSGLTSSQEMLKKYMPLHYLPKAIIARFWKSFLVGN